MSDITNKLTLPEMVELTDAEIDAVAGGFELPGEPVGIGRVRMVQTDDDRAPEVILIVNSEAETIIIPGEGVSRQ